MTRTVGSIGEASEAFLRRNMTFSLRLHHSILLFVLISLHQVPSLSFTPAFHRPYAYKIKFHQAPPILYPTTSTSIIGHNFRTKRRTKTTKSTQVASCLNSSSVTAVCGLLGSSVVGNLVDRFVPISGGIGILATLVFAATLSNLKLAPFSHAIYDTCWTLFLPASLSLLLLANNANNSHAAPDNQGEELSSSPNTTIRTIIQRVSIPFFIGSIGSILGCTASFILSVPKGQTNNVGVLRMAQPFVSSLFSLPSTFDAAMAAGCLCASYIGGSANLFLTNKILSQSAPASAMQQNTSLMAAMSAADLIVMAFYFAGLSIAAESKTLQSVFSRTTSNMKYNKHRPNHAYEEVVVVAEEDSLDETSDVENLKSKKSQIADHLRGTLLVGGLAFAIVQLATFVERYLSTYVPGTGCAIIALVSIWVNKYISSRRTATKTPQRRKEPNFDGPLIWKHMQQAASPMSNVCFHLLFASIGMSANLGHALHNGPACLIFSFMALSVHIATTFLASIGIQRVLPNRLQLELEDILVASNAAIGGPATAAAFAGRLKVDESNPKEQQRKQGFIMAATTWGVVGYALATGIGVTLTQTLLKWVS